MGREAARGLDLDQGGSRGGRAENAHALHPRCMTLRSPRRRDLSKIASPSTQAPRERGFFAFEQSLSRSKMQSARGCEDRVDRQQYLDQDQDHDIEFDLEAPFALQESHEHLRRSRDQIEFPLEGACAVAQLVFDFQPGILTERNDAVSRTRRWMSLPANFLAID